MTRYLFNPVFYLLLAGYFTLQVLGNVEFFRGAVQLLMAISGEELPPDKEVIIEELPDEWQPVASYPLLALCYTESSQLASVVTAHSS